MPIIVNKVEITDDEVYGEMQHHPANNVDSSRHQATQTLVIKQLLLQEAIEKKFVNANVANYLRDEDIELAIESLLKQEISVPEADEQTCERYYQNNLERFIDITTGKQLALEAVVPLIRDYLHTRSLQTGISQYIKVLAGKAKIEGFDMDRCDNPLVQ